MDRNTARTKHANGGARSVRQAAESHATAMACDVQEMVL
jgi:hypothetical protein